MVARRKVAAIKVDTANRKVVMVKGMSHITKETASSVGAGGILPKTAHRELAKFKAAKRVTNRR